MSLLPLTEKQRTILGVIREGLLMGKPPTIRELCERFGISSPNGMSCHLRALEQKGYILGADTKARSIRMTANEIAATRDGDEVTVSTTGPVTMTIEAWKQWFAGLGLAK